MTGFSPATNGSATSITYIQNPGVFMYPGNAFGTLGRNVIEGPGYSDLDIALVKNTRITERIRLQIRVDAFDSLNQVNFNNPVLSLPTPAGGAGSALVPTSSSTFGVITAWHALCGRGFRHFASAPAVDEVHLLTGQLWDIQPVVVDTRFDTRQRVLSLIFTVLSLRLSPVPYVETRPNVRPRHRSVSRTKSLWKAP